MSGSQCADTPTGATCVSPWSGVDKTLILDVSCFLASKRTTRNVLSSRNGIRGESNIHQEAGVVLPIVAANQPHVPFEFVHSPGNKATVLVSNRPVRMKIKNQNGELDLGLVTTFVLTAGLVSVTVTNEKNEGPAELNLVVI